MLQKPFDLPGVALIISGEKGCGKDTLFDLIGEFVIGMKYYFNYQSNKQFFDAYDTNRKDKFLIKLEEADRKYFLDDASYLKSMITAKQNTFNPKLQATSTVQNFIRFIFTTNKSNVAEMSQGERRFVLLNASSEKKGDFAFWDMVRETLFNDTAGRIIADYLLTYDIKDFTPRKLPTNSFQEAVIEAQQTSEELFLASWDGEEISGNDLFNNYFINRYFLDNLDNLFNYHFLNYFNRFFNFNVFNPHNLFNYLNRYFHPFFSDYLNFHLFFINPTRFRWI
jgi:hypothetical protein